MQFHKDRYNSLQPFMLHCTHCNSLKGNILKFYLLNGIKFFAKDIGVSEIIESFSIVSQELQLRECF